MNTIDSSKFSLFIKNLYEEFGKNMGKEKITFYEKKDFQNGLKIQTSIDINGNYSIFIDTDHMDDFLISFEILNIYSQKVIPNIIRILDFDLAGIIGKQLQGYLVNNWILAQQKKRGLDIGHFKMFSNIPEEIGKDSEEFGQNINKILFINNLIRSYPEVFEKHKGFFKENNPTSLNFSKRIMSFYPKDELFSNYEARRITVKAIKEWNKIFEENDLKTEKLNLILSVTPVLKKEQLMIKASSLFKIIPNAIVKSNAKVNNHVIYTVKDSQTAAIFTMDEKTLYQVMDDLNTLNLRDFLKRFNMPYLLKED